MMGEGDSIRLKIKAATLFEKTFQRPLPPKMDPESNMNVTVKMEAITDKEGF